VAIDCSYSSSSSSSNPSSSSSQINNESGNIGMDAAGGGDGECKKWRACLLIRSRLLLLLFFKCLHKSYLKSKWNEMRTMKMTMKDFIEFQYLKSSRMGRVGARVGT